MNDITKQKSYIYYDTPEKNTCNDTNVLCTMDANLIIQSGHSNAVSSG